MKDQTRQLAEWWCLLNGHQWPEEFGKRERIGLDVRAVEWGAFVALDAVAGFAGAALWEERAKAMLDPATGNRLATTPKPKRRKRAPASA